jgi:hypothetical protein
MMRTKIGGWLLILALMAAPGAARAQDLQRWWHAPEARDAPQSAEPAPAVDLDWLMRWCARTDAPAVLILDAPGYIARGQDIGEGFYVPPEPIVGPLSHPRYENGGFFLGAEFLFFIQTRPILSQTVAVRGFRDTNGSITGIPGTFVGSMQEAMNTNQVQGNGSYQPGMNLFLGYRFQNGISVSLDWWHLSESRYLGAAGPVESDGNPGFKTQNTFLYSGVFNFPNSYAGAFASVLVNGVPAVGGTYGIWNAASEMTEQFIQRFEMFQLNTRVPFWETENYRAYGVVGPRAYILWEEYVWRTVQRDVTGFAVASTTAQYTNITSNRLYGAYCGTGHDFYLHSGRFGAWALDLQLNGGLYLDFVKERAGYELGDKSESAHRAANTYSLVPGIDGKLGLMWYPWEAIQVRIGYSFMALFNTYASPRPIDFDYGRINPAYNDGINRLFHGWDIGLALVF